MKKRFISLMLALCIILSMVTASAVADGTAPVLGNNGYPYGKDMTSSSVTLVIDVDNADTNTDYKWQSSSTETGSYNDIGSATNSTLTLSAPESGTWYRCVVDGTPSKAVQVIMASTSGDKNGRIWTDYSGGYYITNGTVAYRVNGAEFDVTGLYKKGSTEYMLQTSYSEEWYMYSSTEVNPSAVGYSSGTSAKLDDLRVSFSESNKYAVIFEADLASTESSFSFGCDTQLGNSITSGSYSDHAALVADVTGDGGLNKISMVGSADSEDKNAPAFIIAPSVSTPASKFWIGYYWNREIFGYNTETNSSETTTEIQGSNVVTTVEETDSGMTMSWMGIEAGSTVGFTFNVGRLGDITGDSLTSPTGSVDIDLSNIEGTVKTDDGIIVSIGGTTLVNTENDIYYSYSFSEDGNTLTVTFTEKAGITSTTDNIKVTLKVLTNVSASEPVNQDVSITNGIIYTVTVQYEDIEGTASASPAKAKEGTEITLAATPNTGYEFDKWEVESGGVTITNNKFTMPEGAVTVKAIFKQAAPTTYTVTYDPGANGTGTQTTATKNAGSPLTLAGAIFTRTGYTQTGWSITDGGTQAYALNASYETDAEATLYPVWTKNTYSVTFDANGGKGEMAAQSFTYGETKTLTANEFTRSGYKFDGWNTAADGSGTAYEDGDSITVTGNLTLYAQWKKIRSSDVGLTITASSSIGGGITPIGETVVKRGCDKTYYISAPKGYTISRVLVDGVNVGAVTEYTFKNISSSHTIHVVFTASKLTVKDFLYGDYVALGAQVGK